MATPTPNDLGNPEAEDREADFAEVPANIWDKVIESDAAFNSRFNEESIFLQQYQEAAKVYYADAMDVNAQGRAIPHLFLRWAEVVGEFVQYVLRGDADDPLDANLSWDPEGGGEAWVRPFVEDSFSNASYSLTPGSTGQFNVIPNTTNGSTETATANEQAWCVIGWIDLRAGNVVPYDYLQADVNDSEGVRRPEFLKYQMESESALGWAGRNRGPLLVEPGFDIDVDVNIIDTGIEMGLWPVGVEVIRADASEFAGVLD